MSDATEKLPAEIANAKMIDEYENRAFRRGLLKIAARTGAVVVVIAALAASSHVSRPQPAANTESN